MKKNKEEVLTLKEILERYPEEWVALLDFELNKKTQEPINGKVAVHDKSLKKVDKALQIYKGRPVSVFYTGEMPEDMGVLFLCQL